MHSIKNWTRWLIVAILPALASGCCHDSQPQRPQPVVQVPQPCPRADRIPAWRVSTATLSQSQGTKLEALLWQRVDDLEFHARHVKADCGTHDEQIPPVPSPSTATP